MNGRASTVVDWPNPSEVFALHVGGVPVPLLLIAIMTFVLITSSGTMALAVKYGYERNRKKCAWLILATAIGGLTFVGMQAFEWSKLIHEGVRPWENPFGAKQFGSFFFMITGFHGTHVSIGVIFLFIFVAYLAFSSTRKAEQNQVWVGMSKETAHQLGTPTSSLLAWIELLKNDTKNLAENSISNLDSHQEIPI